MFDSLRRWAPSRLASGEVPVEARVAAMDAAGVRAGMLCAWRGPRGPLITNDAVAAVIARFPGRFAGVAAAGLAHPIDAVRKLRRCVRDLGFRALRVVPWLWNLPPSDRRYYPLNAECIQLGIPFCLQVGHTGPLCPSEPGRPIPYLDTVALEFPELVIVGGHIGYPWTAEMISRRRVAGRTGPGGSAVMPTLGAGDDVQPRILPAGVPWARAWRSSAAAR
jgi:predicted TIM-barrel fold metal-dependent hydrolase